MYTFGASSRERRSTQTAMYHDLRRPGAAAGADPAVHGRRALAVPAGAAIAVGAPRGVSRRSTTWKDRRHPRVVGAAAAGPGKVNAALEHKRKDKVIGNSLGARVRSPRPDRSVALLEQHRADLPMLFIVSDVELTDR